MAARCAVVIPSYNHARYVGAALESALAPDAARRTASWWSTTARATARAAVVERLPRARRRAASCQENAGAHAALNRAVALAAADCEFVAILNSDDLYEPRAARALPRPRWSRGPTSASCAASSR